MSHTSGFPQTSPGQFQPAYTQAPPGQPFSTPQVQPGQYYAQPGQPIQVVVQQARAGQRPNQRRPTTPLTTAYWKSSFIADKLVEFLILLATWICIASYSDRMIITDGKANFFKGITVFCWVMVIVFQIAFAFFSSITQRYFSKPRHFTIICFVVQVILTILLIACTVNLVPLAHDNTKLYDFLTERGKTTLITLYLALIFGFYACLCFLDDVRSLYKMIGTQKAEEQAVITEQQQVVGSFTQPVPAEPELQSQL
ncbi:uncharacterized protein LOC110062006 isoform X1 [Orbicella faveolata]|uniref:uncharacterized protein LOC110062006 isoform X1 n=1 Tax=Orbicella faveolata TaxID=48498 RepID=UPI0009E5FF52|nr:uncharacterized protein LOC110062006 isoform X1 [Orbicella faveolata]